MALTVFAGNNENNLFVTNEHAAQRHAGEKAKDTRKTTIYAGDFGVRDDSILLKRKQAQKQAMKIMSDMFETEKKADAGINEMSDKVQELQEQKLTGLEELKRLDAEKAELEAGYDSAEEGSEERQNLDARRKELEEETAIWQKTVASSDEGTKSIHRAISDTKIERLKSEPMKEAQNQAEAVLEAANKAIIGDLMNEAKKHIEEKMQEENEKAKKAAEKKEELEEKLEAKDEKEEKMEEWIESTKDLAETKQKADKEIEEMIDELKLIQDDLKGAAVDANL